MSRTVYQSADVDGVSILDREAGSPDARARPSCSCHGSPSSSRMWEPLLTRLANQFHLVAPDYPGFGHSNAPDPAGFPYTFNHLAVILFSSPIWAWAATSCSCRTTGVRSDSGWRSRTQRACGR